MNTWDKKRKNMQRYDLIAEMYNERYSEEQQSKYNAALSLMHFSKNSFVLDVGCGTGLFFNCIAARVRFVVGADLSRRLLLKAKEYVGKFDNVHLVCADADYLPFSKNYFDAIFAFTLLQNLPKPILALKEILRVAKPSAFVVITGLKKVFSLSSFNELLCSAGLNPFKFINEACLKCYIAISRQIKLGY